jgi:rubrerythrin
MKVEAPERIWIESEGECPYFYHEEELSDVAPPITEYVRADKLEELAAEVEALRAAMLAAAPQQTASVDEVKETDLWRCTVCGRVGTVGRCCGEETRERVNMEQLLAENERLRDEVERLRTDGASAVRWAPSSAHWSEVLKDLFGPDARNGIDVLETRWRKELERAERLAEALRELEEREQRDEALLRQALEALEELQYAVVSTAKTDDVSLYYRAIVALHERLGVKE